MSEQQFHIGQIFVGIYPPEAADFCNDSQGTESACYIKGIEPAEDGQRRFQIVPNDPPSEEEIKQQEIQKYQSYLNETDWYAVRFAETGVEIPAEIRQQRQVAREEISRLREELEKL